jgi:hypothetical protein
MTASPDAVAGILFQHYRDSRENIETQLRLRMYIAAGVFAVQFAFAVEILDPAAFENIATSWISNAAHSDPAQLERFWVHHALTSLLWFLLCCFVAQVLSRTAVIAREVRYMLVLEERLSRLLGEGGVTRMTDFQRVPEHYIGRANKMYVLGPAFPTAILAIAKLAIEVRHAAAEGLAAGVFAVLDGVMFCILAYSMAEYLAAHFKAGK